MKFVQNRMVRTSHNFELFDKKWFTVPFDEVSDTIFEDASITETIFDDKLSI